MSWGRLRGEATTGALSVKSGRISRSTVVDSGPPQINHWPGCDSIVSVELDVAAIVSRSEFVFCENVEFCFKIFRSTPRECPFVGHRASAECSRATRCVVSGGVKGQRDFSRSEK